MGTMVYLPLFLYFFSATTTGFVLNNRNLSEEFKVKPSPSIEGHYKQAAVASDTQICSPIGIDIMKNQGGSAVDATIATLLCVGVANSMSNGIGGGHFMTIYKKDEGKVYTIIAREMAPGAASKEMFKNASSEKGGLSIAVPGELMGMWEAHKIGGKLPWKNLFAPTIKLCRDGILVSPPLAVAMVSEAKKTTSSSLMKLITNPETNKLYVVGEKMKRPRLAATLQTIADEGVIAFYQGSLTDIIVREIQDAGGIITSDDLKNYVAEVKDSVSITIHDNIKVYSPPPPSSGVVFQYILNILDGYNMDASTLSTTEKQILTSHRTIEAFKYAYAKRSALGDPSVESDQFKQRIEQLVTEMTSKDFGENTRAEISDTQTFNFTHYHPEFNFTEDHGTAHLSVLGPKGDAVAVTSTINLYFGSDVVGEDTGIIYNDEMDDFSTPNTTNFFGVPASPANYIKPGKRPLSSMCPSILVGKDGHVVLVVGASGGTKITTAVSLVTTQTLWFKWDVKQAIDFPRIHHQLVPQTTQIEYPYPKAVVEGLKKIGHNVTMIAGGSNVQGILQLKPGTITANCDYRKYGIPAGY
ncbi:hypothetical protein SNE40_006339 [Patella caerulea]|uniref:Uncharacterized protein n=1 Tax=Patella caerulea TaxID=87958 RepID=A0AAN8K2F3_PATCE